RILLLDEALFLHGGPGAQAPFVRDRPAGERVAAADDPGAGDRDERHRLRLARLEADRGPGGDVGGHAVGEIPIELQRAVHFDEVIVAPHLDWTVATVRDRDPRRLTLGIQLDLSGHGQYFPCSALETDRRLADAPGRRGQE